MSKIHRVVFRAVDEDKFLMLEKGIKKVETRAASPKYSNIKAGDEFLFVCGDLKFQRKISKVILFESIDDLLKKYSVKDIMPHIDTKEELVKEYYSYPDYENKIKEFGLLAFELEK